MRVKRLVLMMKNREMGITLNDARGDMTLSLSLSDPHFLLSALITLSAFTCRGEWGKLCHFSHVVCCPLCQMNGEMRGKVIIFQAVCNQLIKEESVDSIEI